MSDTPSFDHAGLVVLDADACDVLLAGTPIGRIAMLADGDVQIFPVNYVWQSPYILVRTAEGTKLSAAELRPAATFEIDGWNPDTRTGWSVVVKGVAEVLDEDELGHDVPTDLRPWADAKPRRRWLRIRAEEVTGRKIQHS